MKPSIEIEQGKLVLSANLSTTVDKDGDGRKSIEVEAPVKIKADLYEVLNEVAKKDSALLDAVLSQLNYKKAE